MRTTRALLVVGGLAAVLTLTACAAEASPRRTVLPTPDEAATRSSAPARTPTPSTAAPTSAPAPPAIAVSVTCTNGAATVTGDPGAYVLVGACDEVTVAGAGITLRAGGAAIGALVVQGDANTVTAASLVRAVTIEGQGNVVVAAALDALTLRGQRNRVTSAERIAVVQIAGNGNTIDAPAIGAATVNGDGNTYPGS